MKLVAGSSAVARPLSELWLREGLIADDSEAAARPELPDHSIILPGSCWAMTNRQVAAWIAEGGPAYQIDPFHSG